MRRGRKALSIRAFARLYRLSYSRLQRELKAGFTGVLLCDKVHGGWICPEYSAILAQQRAEQANAAKGRRPVVTNLFAARLVAFLARGFSVATCLHTLRLKGWERLSSQRTVYYHLKDGVIVLPKDRLRYRPRKTRRRAIRTMTTDRNAPEPKAKGHGCEFLDQPALERILRAPVYHTHAYASWENGSVEHANSLLRFWFPKGTDFSKVSLAKIILVQNRLNALLPQTPPPHINAIRLRRTCERTLNHLYLTQKP